jgi:hypothetical protein
VRLVYPEDLVLQIASEWGTPVSVALMILGFLAAASLVRALRHLEPITVAAAAAVTGVLVHELADFGLELPGVAFMTAIALGVVVGRAQKWATRLSVRVSPRQWAAAGAAWVLALAGAAWAAGHTLDVDTARMVAATDAKPSALPSVRPTLRATSSRHPADDTLELLAARLEMRIGGAETASLAMHHLNRALLLHPANWQGHRMAARLLAAVGRRSQAALEYRLAFQYGMTPDFSELERVLGVAAVDAVPQTPENLLGLARYLVAHHAPAGVDAAGRRAVELSGNDELVLLAQLELVQQLGNAALVAPAARAVLAVASMPSSFAAAAKALDGVKDATGADAAIATGLKAHPDPSLTLLGTRMRLDRGDLDGARALIASATNLTLADRKRMEEFLAELADRSGDPAGAARARARARAIDRALKETAPGYTTAQ